jgi:hypothetical protein
VKLPPEIASAAGKYLAAWVIDQCRIREIVRRPFAIIEGQIVPVDHVVYHCPEAMK